MEGKQWLAAGILMMAVVLAACEVAQETRSIQAETPETRIEGLEIDMGLTRFEDEEAGVVCWALVKYMDGFGVGLSCLPKADTLLAVMPVGGD